MTYELKIYNIDLTLLSRSESEEELVDLLINSRNLDITLHEAIKEEEIEILIHQIMKGDKGEDGKSPYIGENGNWWEYDDELKAFVDTGVSAKHPYISLERLRHYLYRVTFDRLPEDNGGESPVLGACSSYVKDGKLYRNLDWNYDESASFIVRTRDFEGMSFLTGLNDGALDDEKIAQLPYRIVDGENNNGIRVSTHILFNDWSWTGCGERNINLTRLPFLVMERVKSMATISQDLSGVLDNLYAPEGLLEIGYLIQLLVTDGTTTYAILPPTSEGEAFVLEDISEYPKLTNFRWIGGESVVRGDLQDRPTGVERYNLMPCDMKDIRFTKAYEAPDRLSEFIGLRGTTKDSTDAQLEAIYNDARAIYLDRERDGQTWQTMHSVVYGAQKMEALWIQENWNDNIIGGDVTKEYVDGEIARVEGEIPTKLTDLDNDGNFVQDEDYTHTDNNYTDEEKEKLDGIEEGAEKNAPNTVIDANYVHTDNNYTTPEKNKLAGVEEGAEKNLPNTVVDASYVHTDNNYTTPEKTKLAGLENYDDTALKARVSSIEGKIPSEASSTNKLADKEFVNSSITTNTAFFRGTWDLVEDLGLTKDATEEQIAAALATVITEVTNNDYSFVFYNNPTTGIAEYYDRYKYSTEDGWGFEYRLNNSSFTAAQWAAINSGLTSSDKTALDAALALIATFGDIVTHNASEFATASQGSKADSAIQGVKRNGVDLTPDAQKKVNVLVPTKTSDLTNDSNFVADADYVHTDNNYSDEDAERVAEVNAKILPPIHPRVDFDLEEDITIDTTGATNGFEYGTYTGSTIPGYTDDITGIGSQNYHIQSSYAWAKLSFTLPRAGRLVVTCANNGESTYDFGLISQIDQELAKSTTADSSTTILKKSFSNQQVVEDVVYEDVPAGQHFITVKYKKDGSADQGMDRFVVMAMYLDGDNDTIIENVDTGARYVIPQFGETGGADTPVYIDSEGKFKPASKYAGGTNVNLNGSSKAGADAAMYAPTAAGTSGYRLVSNGSGAPLWQQPTMHLSCTTAASTTAKTASCSNFKLATGVRCVVKMTNNHTGSTAPTLNINSTGAKSMYWVADGMQITKDNTWDAGDYLDCIYDGAYWRVTKFGISAGGTKITFVEWS